MTVTFKNGSKEVSKDDTLVVVEGVSRAGVDTAIGRFLLLSPPKPEDVYRYGHDELIVTPELAGSVFVRGFLVGHKDSLKFAVNFQHLKLDRDRSNPLQSRKLKEKYFSLWARAVVRPDKVGERLLGELFDLAVSGHQANMWAPVLENLDSAGIDALAKRFLDVAGSFAVPMRPEDASLLHQQAPTIDDLPESFVEARKSLCKTLGRKKVKPPSQAASIVSFAVSGELADALSRAALLPLGDLLALRASAVSDNAAVASASANADEAGVAAELDDAAALAAAAKRVLALEAELAAAQTALAHMRGEQLDDIDDVDELQLLQRRLLLATERVERRITILETEEKTLCKVCTDGGIETAFVPCGHSVACMKCATKLHGTCCVCRSPIQQVLKLFN